MTFVVVVICGTILVLALRGWMRGRMKDVAATLPVGTVQTWTYTTKSGALSEQFSKMPMESHINTMVRNGWEVVNQSGLSGHLRLGRTLTGAALTGGLSLLAGGSRTADRVTITYRRVEVPPRLGSAPITSSQVPQETTQMPQALPHSSALLDGLKEEMFQLEIERQQGRISQPDYERSKAALSQMLDRFLSR